MSSNLFNINYNGKFIDKSIEGLRHDFEFNTDTKNSNIFLFKSELPALVSIIKRFALYFVAVIVLFFTYIVQFFTNSFFIVLFNFSIYSLTFLLFLLLLLYLLNSFFTLKKLIK